MFRVLLYVPSSMPCPICGRAYGVPEYRVLYGEAIWCTGPPRPVWGRPYSGRYTHKTSGFKTSGFKMSGFKTSETSGLQTVRFTKCYVYKTSGLKNVRLQNVLTSKYFETTIFKKKYIDLTYAVDCAKYAINPT
jgi:hypothetical protein